MVMTMKVMFTMNKGMTIGGHDHDDHVRRGLEHRFPRSTPGETRARFARRMAKVQDYINSPEFKARDGGGLAALAESLRARCQRVSLLKGERLRT